jgi:hypothetical protein
VGGGFFDKSGFGEVVRQQLGPVLGNLGKSALKGLGDEGM